MTPTEIIEACARAAHEVNRVYSATLGDVSHAPWDMAPEWVRESALKGVQVAFNGATNAESHGSWMAQKFAEGWVYGAVKDAEKKTHPCLVAYDKLSPELRAKDGLFQAVVRAMQAALAEASKPA